MEIFVESIFFELTIAVLIYFAGVLTSKLWHFLLKNREERLFKENVQKALDIIYEAEEKFPGRKKGIEKLEFSVKKFMQETKFNNYQSAQNYIIQIFNLTKLSKVDFPNNRKK